MPTTPEDADALFDLSTSETPAAADANAASSTGASEPGAPPQVGTDYRKENRVKVSWPARVQLPDARVIDLRVRDLSDTGVGLVTPVHLPSGATLNFAVGVPGLADLSKITPVAGTVRTSYCVLQGNDIHCGGTWVQIAPEARELIGRWLRKLRR